MEPGGDQVERNSAPCPGRLWCFSVSRLRFSLVQFLLFVAFVGLIFGVASTGWSVRHAAVQAHPGIVRGMSFSPDRRLLTTVGDGQLRIWETESGQLYATPKPPADYGAVFSPNNDRLAWGDDCDDGSQRLYLWNIRSQQVVAVLVDDLAYVYGIEFSGTGVYLGVASQLGVKLWDVRTQNKVMDHSSDYSDRDTQPTCMAFATDNSTLAVGYSSGTIRLWDVATGKLKGTLAGKHWGSAMAYSPNGEQLFVVLGGFEGAIQIWNLGTTDDPTEVRLGQRVTISPDTKQIAFARGGEVVIWDVKDQHEVRRLRAHTGRISDLAFSDDSRLLASSGFDYTVKLLDLESGKRIDFLPSNLPHTDRWPYLIGFAIWLPLWIGVQWTRPRGVSWKLRLAVRVTGYLAFASVFVAAVLWARSYAAPTQIAGSAVPVVCERRAFDSNAWKTASAYESG